MDEYGVAYAINEHEEPYYDSNLPQVISVPTKEETIEIARRMRGYCKYITPFRNAAHRKIVDWHYIKKNQIVIQY